MLQLNQLIGFGGRSQITAYRYFRLTIDKIKTTGTTGQPIYAWDLFDGTSWVATNMTSNTAPSPLVASCIDGSANAWRLHDGSLATFHQVAGNYVSQVKSPSDWHKIDLGSGNEITPTKIRVAWYNTGGIDTTGEDFKLEASNNDSSWVLFQEWTGQASQTHQTLVEYPIAA